jgi:hypothetical protein
MYTQQLNNLYTLNLKMEEAHTSEMSASLPTTTWCNNTRTELTNICEITFNPTMEFNSAQGPACWRTCV